MSLDNSAVVPALPTGGYDIPYSVKFNGDQWLIKTDGSGNRQKFTASFWFKRTRLGNLEEFWNCTDNQTGDFLLRFNNDNLNLYDQAGSFTTNAKYRDTASWMHCVLRVDTTQSTSSNRLRLYINGEQVTSFSSFTTPSQNSSFHVGVNGYRHIFGAYWKGYPNGIRGITHLLLSEFHLVDGQSLDPSNFGQFNNYGGWEAIEYTGSHGTNGYYHKFDNASNLGDVEVGANFGTVHSLSARYQLIDSPTNNFATLNAIAPSISSLSEGNLRHSGTTDQKTHGTFGFSSGKIYFEHALQSGSGHPEIGVMRLEAGIPSGNWGEDTNAVSVWTQDGQVRFNNNTSTSIGAFADNDILQVALDIDSGKVWFGKNGTWYNSGNPASGTNATKSGLPAGTWTASLKQYRYGVFNFGQDSSFAGNKTAQGNTDSNNKGDFYYTPPSGYVALCTDNLPNPDVIPSEHFNTVIWTGQNYNSNRSITGVGFSPDFVWSKSRTDNWHHLLYDKVRGAGSNKELVSSGSGSEGSGNQDAYGYLSSFDSDGFTGSVGSSTNEYFNDTNKSFVAWNWKANGSGASNTDGTVTSTVSANQDAGFSIVTYTSASSGTYTYGHGLNQAPDLVIDKMRNQNWNWGVMYRPYNGSFLNLNTTGGLANGYNIFATGGGASVLQGAVNQTHFANTPVLSYCFHSVDGFSKVGSYTGNGSSDGTFVYTGFRPAFVMFRKVSGDRWIMSDSARGSYNFIDEFLDAGSDHVETNFNITGGVDYLSNGFKWRHNDGSINASGADYIYIAFAETPFKHTNGR